MAGIEKICEIDSDDCGYAMYGYKHNLIQVKPEYRKLFRNKKHVLYIFKPEKRLQHRFGCTRAYNPNEMEWYDPPFENEQEFIDWLKPSERLINEYTYLLYVPEVQGRVKGKFLNWSKDLSTVKRKLKRMLRCKKLNIVKVDMPYKDWYLKGGLNHEMSLL